MSAWKTVLICLLLALTGGVATASADEAAARLLSTLTSQPADEWTPTLVKAREQISGDFMNLTMQKCLDEVNAGHLEQATRLARIFDTADFVRRGQKERRVIGLALMGRRLNDLGKSAEAIALALTMEKDGGDGYDAAMIIGVANMHLRHFDEAIAAFQRADVAHPRMEQTWYGLALAYQATQQTDRQIEALRRVLEINPRSGLAIDTLDVLEGAAHMGTISTNPTALDAYKKAEAFYRAGNLPDAMVEYRKAMEADPKFCKPIAYLAQCYFMRDDPDTAIRFYARAVEVDPNDAQVQYFFGDALQRLYDKTHTLRYLDEAASHYRAALTLFPGYRRARENLDTVTAKKAAARVRQ